MQLAPAHTRDAGSVRAGQACVASLLLPVAGPPGAPPPRADLVRRGMLRVVRERAPDRDAGRALADPFEDADRRAHLGDWVREHARVEEHSMRGPGGTSRPAAARRSCVATPPGPAPPPLDALFAAHDFG